MSQGIRKRHAAETKAAIALEAIREQKTVAQIASEFSIHPAQVSQWKEDVVENAASIFQKKRTKSEDDDEKTCKLYEEISRLKIELEWLKKNLQESGADLRRLLEKGNGVISIKRHCELIGIPRSTFYYHATDMAAIRIDIMHKVDEIYTECPFYGSRRIAATLRSEGIAPNRKRIQGVMQAFGIEGIFPRRNLSKLRHDHKIYPYLLRGVPIERPSHVWSTDITYILMAKGYLYLVAVIDWYSRYVLSWELSNTLETAFCIRALNNALKIGKPDIFNTDQGCQFTSRDFTGILVKSPIARFLPIRIAGANRG